MADLPTPADKLFICQKEVNADPKTWYNHYKRSISCVDHNKLWKILKEMGIADHLTCLLRSLYAGQEATVRTRHGTTDWFQIGKGVRQGCILVLEKTVGSPLDCKEIQPVHSEGDQCWVFIGRTNVEAETPILWLPDAKS